jgi:hypothetical protein
MEFSGPKLLVYTIILVVVLGIAFHLFLPFIFEKTEPREELLRTLKKAETRLGKAIESNEVFFAREEVLGAKTLESKNRVVKFECFNQMLCCHKNESCSKVIEWNNKRIYFNENKNLSLFVRCEQNFNLSVCLVSVGKPAQVELLDLSIPKEIDLKKETKVVLKGKIFNSGNINGEKIELIGSLNKIVKENGKETKEFLKEKTKEFGELLAGEEKEFTLYFNLTEKGNYELKARVQGENTGFDERALRLKVIDSRKSHCTATAFDEKGQFSEEKQLCYKKFYCEGCEYAFQCKEAWEETQPKTSFELGSKRFALHYYSAIEGKCD